MPYLEIIIGLVVAGSIWLAIRMAKSAAKEKARADSATETVEVLEAFAEPVAPAKTLEALKDRARKRAERRAARRKSGK